MSQRFFSLSASDLAESLATTREPRARCWRLALIGAGMMGREHVRVAALFGRAEICGVFDPEGDSIARVQAEHTRHFGGTLPVYASLDEAVADNSVDAYIVASPNYTHLAVLEQLIAADRPILLEKPMATTLADAARVVDLAEQAAGFIQLGMQYRFKSQYVEAFRAAKGDAALGAIQTIALAEYRPPFLDKVGQWNKFNRYSGGTLVEKCCHYFDLMNLMAESVPVSIFARGGRAVNFLEFEQAGVRSDIDDHAFVIVSYDNGLHASFTLNMFCQELYEELVVVGQRGRLVATERSSFRPGIASTASLTVEVPGHSAYRPIDVTYPAQIESSGHSGATLFAHRAFIQRLDGESADAATPEQGLWSLVVASAAQESLQTGSVVDVMEFSRRQGVALPAYGQVV